MRTWIPDARFLPYFTWKQVEALPKDETIIIVPTAAVEQHGHHLPLATDTLLNNLSLGKGLALLAPELHIYALAPVCYGKSNEHLGYPGTISMRAETYMAVIRDIAASLHAGGFKKMVLLNSHGGNSALNEVMAREIRVEFGMRVFTMGAGGCYRPEGMSEQERKYGFHANSGETSLLLYATPDLVHTDKYTVNYIAHVDDPPSLISQENGPANYAWVTSDIAPSGVMGDPNGSTAEKGQLWAEGGAKSVAAILTEMYHYKNNWDK
jgi:creatinine amidohydrolase